jgi:hypothetical protein
MSFDAIFPQFLRKCGNNYYSGTQLPLQLAEKLMGVNGEATIMPRWIRNPDRFL